jgi:hypothetical protein
VLRDRGIEVRGYPEGGAIRGDELEGPLQDCAAAWQCHRVFAWSRDSRDSEAGSICTSPDAYPCATIHLTPE